MLVLPGGFSYGDDLGAGKLWAVALAGRLADALTRLHRTRAAGARHLQRLPGAGQGGAAARADERMRATNIAATLTRNDSGRASSAAGSTCSRSRTARASSRAI